MKSIALALFLVVILVVIDSGNCQFYVDIEHSLPRIGKRGEGELLNTQQKIKNLKEYLNYRKPVNQQQVHEEIDDYEKELFLSAAKIFRLIKLLDKNTHEK